MRAHDLKGVVEAAGRATGPRGAWLGRPTRKRRLREAPPGGLGQFWIAQPLSLSHTFVTKPPLS